jgi:MFS family permease
MSQFFQIAQHVSPLIAALRFVPWPAPALVVAPLVGSWSAKRGNRPFLVAGMALHAIAMVWFALAAHASTTYLSLCGPLVLSGIGIACVFPTVSSEVVSSVAPERMGIAAGVNGSIRELGGVLGVTVLASIFAHWGGYTSGASFVAGLTPAITVGGAVVLAGAVAAALIPARRRVPAAETGAGVEATVAA